ncbi:MAG: hypothetical protein E8G75_02735 [Sulfitobacter sp. SK025]|nr:MAG: hypothetical protein E8G75_02735 [Sulfitobacter sp. SK025]
MIKRMDADNNGTLSADEFAKAHMDGRHGKKGMGMGMKDMDMDDMDMEGMEMKDMDMKHGDDDGDKKPASE